MNIYDRYLKKTYTKIATTPGEGRKLMEVLCETLIEDHIESTKDTNEIVDEQTEKKLKQEQIEGLFLSEF